MKSFQPFAYQQVTAGGPQQATTIHTRELDHAQHEAATRRLVETHAIEMRDKDDEIKGLKTANRKNKKNWSVIDVAENASFQANKLETLTVQNRELTKNLANRDAEIVELRCHVLVDHIEAEVRFCETVSELQDQVVRATENAAASEREKIEIGNEASELRKKLNKEKKSYDLCYEEKVRAEKTIEQNSNENVSLDLQKNRLEKEAKTTEANMKKQIESLKNKHAKSLSAKDTKYSALTVEFREARKTWDDVAAKNKQLIEVSNMNLKEMEKNWHTSTNEGQQLRAQVIELEEEIEGEKLVSNGKTSQELQTEAECEVLRQQNDELRQQLDQRTIELSQKATELRKEKSAHLDTTKKLGNDSGLSQEEMIEAGEAVVVAMTDPDLKFELETLNAKYKEKLNKMDQVLAWNEKLQDDVDEKIKEIADIKKREDMAWQRTGILMEDIQGLPITQEGFKAEFKSLLSEILHKAERLRQGDRKYKKDVSNLETKLLTKIQENEGYLTTITAAGEAHKRSAEKEIENRALASHHLNLTEHKLHASEARVVEHVNEISDLNRQIVYLKTAKVPGTLPPRNADTEAAELQVSTLQSDMLIYQQHVQRVDRTLATEREQWAASNHVRKVAQEVEGKIQGSRTKLIGSLRREKENLKGEIMEAGNKIERHGFEIQSSHRILGQCVKTATTLLNCAAYALTEAAKNELDHEVKRANSDNEGAFGFDLFVFGKIQKAEGHVINLFEESETEEGMEMPNSGIHARFPDEKTKTQTATQKEAKPTAPRAREESSEEQNRPEPVFPQANFSDLLESSAGEEAGDEISNSNSTSIQSLPEFSPSKPEVPTTLPTLKRMTPAKLAPGSSQNKLATSVPLPPLKKIKMSTPKPPAPNTEKPKARSKKRVRKAAEAAKVKKTKK